MNSIAGNQLGFWTWLQDLSFCIAFSYFQIVVLNVVSPSRRESKVQLQLSTTNGAIG